MITILISPEWLSDGAAAIKASNGYTDPHRISLGLFDPRGSAWGCLIPEDQPGVFQSQRISQGLFDSIGSAWDCLIPEDQPGVFRSQRISLGLFDPRG